MTNSNEQQDALIDELLKDYTGDPKRISGESGLLKRLEKRFVERALEGEMGEHLGYAPHARGGHGSGNARNGYGRKSVQSEAGQFEIAVPRDRTATLSRIWRKSASADWRALTRR